MNEELNKEKKEKIIIAVVGIIVIILAVFLTSYIMDLRERAGIIDEMENGVPVPDETLTSPIVDGRVVTPGGEDVRYDVEPGSPEAPQQSISLGEDQINPDTIRIMASRTEGYQPSEFTVRSGDVVTLAITADSSVYVFKFRDPALSAVAVGVGGGETRSINFNAPAPGIYEFYCDVPGCHIEGRMIVQ